MNSKILSQLLSFLAALVVTAPLFAGTPEQEKEFVAKYKTAFEAGDKATLQSFLYTKGANPMALEFYKMMQEDGVGGKLKSIELLPLTPEDVAKAEKVQDGPNGVKFRMPLKPVKKLKLTVETKTGDSTSTSSAEILIAENDGKFVIPVPVDAK